MIIMPLDWISSQHGFTTAANRELVVQFLAFVVALLPYMIAVGICMLIARRTNRPWLEGATLAGYAFLIGTVIPTWYESEFYGGRGKHLDACFLLWLMLPVVILIRSRVQTRLRKRDSALLIVLCVIASIGAALLRDIFLLRWL